MNMPNRYRIFWGAPDSWVQYRYGYSENDLEIQLKVLSLLFDEIIVSPAFLLESDKIRCVFEANKAFLEKGVIKFTFSNLTHNFEDYVAIKSQETTVNITNATNDFSPLTPNYRDKNVIKIAKEWGHSICKTKRNRDLPKIITDLLLNQFMPRVSSIDEVQNKFQLVLGERIRDAEYYTKYIYYQSLKSAEIAPHFYGPALDSSTISFLFGSAFATESIAGLVSPYADLPLKLKKMGLIGSIPLVLGIFNSLLSIKREIVTGLSTDQILRIRESNEWNLFKNLYFQTIFSIEGELYPSIIYKVLKGVVDKEFSINRISAFSKFIDSSMYGALSSTSLGVIAILSGLDPITSIITSTTAPALIGSVIKRGMRKKKKSTPFNDLKNLCLYYYEQTKRYDKVTDEVRKMINYK